MTTRCGAAVRAVGPLPAEVAARLPGDDLVPAPDVVMDRAFTLPGEPPVVWPWFVQLGKDRAGWYLPASVERLLPRSRRALRHVSATLQGLQVGQQIPDWGGRRATLQVAVLATHRAIAYRSVRGRVQLSWAIVLTPLGPDSTRVQLRLRLGPVRHRWLAGSAGRVLDLLTVSGLAAGLRERLRTG